jgi:hypothetical protein
MLVTLSGITRLLKEEHFLNALSYRWLRVF